MSKENVEVVRKALDLWNPFMHGELSAEATAEAGAPFVDPRIELVWHDERTMPDQPQRLEGIPEILRFWEQMRGAYVQSEMEPLEIIKAPDGRVVTSLRQSARGRESSVPLVFHYFLVWTIRDGKAIKQELFRHRADALEAAGLRE